MKLRSILLVAVISFVCAVQALPQDLKYLVYDKDQIPASVYKQRRERLMKELGGDAAVFLFSASEKNRNGDGDYSYRQDDNFYYLTGFTEPNAVLALSGKGILIPDYLDSTRSDTVHEILFVQPRDRRIEQWTGRRFGPEGAVQLIGVQAAMTNDKFGRFFPMLVPDTANPHIFVASLPEKNERDADILMPLREAIGRMKLRTPPLEPSDPGPIIRKYRMIKDSSEIALITRAAHISAIAHRQAMMSCKPVMSEYELQAVYEYVFRRMGSEFNAYPCIVGSAENSIVLHYESNRRNIADGDIVLADCGAEYHYYASDLTRTYPANGKFSDAQRKVYQVVLNAQNEAIGLMKPGAVWRDISAAADSILEDGLYGLGIIKSKERKDLRRFYPHGLGHAVGLDVHDVNSPTMEPGMIYTVEPGIYIPENSEGVDPKFFNIGVRIEDDILITAGGHSILTAEAPREIEEIESLMQQKGIGDIPLK